MTQRTCSSLSGHRLPYVKFTKHSYCMHAAQLCRALLPAELRPPTQVMTGGESCCGRQDEHGAEVLDSVKGQRYCLLKQYSLTAHLRRLGRNRKEGKSPQRKPPTCEMCDVPVGVVATVATKKHRKASIISARMIGLQHHCQASHAHSYRRARYAVVRPL